MQLSPPPTPHHPALPQRAPSLGTYVRCSEFRMANGNVCFTAKRGSLDRNCLLAASNLPLWPLRLEGKTGTGRMEGLTWFDKKKLRHAELSDPFFFYYSIKSFFLLIQKNLLSFNIKKKEQLLEPNPPKPPPFFFG